MLLESVPAVHCDAIVPPRAELGQPGVLRLEFEGGDLLERILLWVPVDTDVVDGLLVQVLQHLRAEGVRGFVSEMKRTQGLGDDVDGVVVGVVGVDKGELFFAEREDAVFGDVGAVAVGRLGVFGHCSHWVRLVGVTDVKRKWERTVLTGKLAA
jgi:hypothetical protein